MKLMYQANRIIIGRSGSSKGVSFNNDFDMSFNVSYTSDGEPGKASGTINNVSGEIINQYIDAPDTTVEIIAGYEYMQATIFAGAIEVNGLKVYPGNQPKITFSAINNYTGTSVIKKNNNEKYYDEIRNTINVNTNNDTYFNVVSNLCKLVGLTLINYSGDKRKAIQGSITFYGNVHQILYDIGKTLGLLVSIFDNNVSFFDPNDSSKTTKGKYFVVGTKYNSLISLDRNYDKEKGFDWSVKSVMLPSLRPGDYFRVERYNNLTGKETNINLRIRDITFDGLKKGNNSMTVVGVQV
jgi:hypothetical protein